MHADELRTAIHRVVEVLNKADILAVVKEYRTAKGDQRAVAAARLGHSGAVIMENMDKFNPEEKAVVKCMFLESLGTTQYWQGLLASAGDPQKNTAELVHLFSRVMFASTHLPNLANLLGNVGASTATTVGQPLTGEAQLAIRLTDAGERASDPDRIARSIDGIDMLYSACASIARKPAMDLRLDGISGVESRDIHFMGERDSVAAVSAVIASIPEALEEIHPDDDIDLDELVSSLSIFDDLNTLANLGTFTQTDLKDISETMHQGAMLVLESGVILVDESASAPQHQNQNSPAQIPSNSSVVQQQAPAGATPPILTRRPSEQQHPDERDEHYERYLREREAMQRGGAAPIGARAAGNQQVGNTNAGNARGGTQAEVDELLKNLGRSRDR